MFINPKRIIVLAPHTDDGEWGAGGSLAKWKESGSEIIYVAFSSCQESLPNGMAADTLIKECQAATKVLGVSDLIQLDFKVRYFTDDRQAILEEMVKLNKQFQPDLVLTPCSTDLHQDHNTIYNESLRGFKNRNLLGYELIWNNIHMSTTFFNTLEKRHVDSKSEAIACYHSQEFRNYHNATFVQSLARTRGTQIGSEFAEAFEVIRLIS
jgi:LmbE family N-acetylglucosaminyl deacetylase